MGEKVKAEFLCHDCNRLHAAFKYEVIETKDGVFNTHVYTLFCPAKSKTIATISFDEPKPIKREERKKIKQYSPPDNNNIDR